MPARRVSGSAASPQRCGSNGASAAKTLLDNVGDGKLAAKLAGFLVELAGQANMIVTPEQLMAWLDGEFNPMIDRIVKLIEKQKAAEAAFTSNVGNFGMQAALLKKAFAETEKDPGDDAPID